MELNILDIKPKIYNNHIMDNLKELNDRINELQQIIDLESDNANEGCVRSRQLVINAQMEIDNIRDSIEQLALANCLV